MQVSYSRRIQRPSLWSLNPFFSISDSRNFWVGNPNLRPSYADSYELGYLKNFDNSSFYFGVYYRHSTNIEQRITSVVDTLGLSNVTITKPENLGLRNSMGIEMNGSLEISKWWNLNGNVEIIGWNCSEPFTSRLPSQLAVNLGFNEFRGKRSIQLTIQDIQI